MMLKQNLTYNIRLQLKECLLKRKTNVLLFVLTLICFSCSQQIYTLKQIKELDATHSIKSPVVHQIIQKVESDGVFDNTANSFIMLFEKENDQIFNISVCKTEFEIFREEKSLFYFKNLKGYFSYKNDIILLYGTIDKNLFNKENGKLENIMRHKKDDDFIIYEPNFYEYILKNGVLDTRVKD